MYRNTHPTCLLSHLFRDSTVAEPTGLHPALEPSTHLWFTGLRSWVFEILHIPGHPPQTCHCPPTTVGGHVVRIYGFLSQLVTHLTLWMKAL
jgi:hypothetical protein